MRKIDFSCSSYSLKFNKPFETAKGIIKERKGFLIYLKSDSGKTGTGDAAPFPEFGSESYTDAEKKIKDIKLNISLNFGDILNSIEKSLLGLEDFPALRHGFEQALLNLISKEKNISLNEILNETSKKEIRVNAVISFRSPEDTVSEAKEYIKQGHTTIKIKAGRTNFEDDIACISAVRKAVGNNIKIRIDANGKWQLKEAVNNLKRLEAFSLEYVEQPVNTFKDFIELKKSTGIPLAADESIRTAKDAGEFIQHKAANVLVLKPMMLGGIIPTLKIKDAAEQSRIRVIITSSFESVVGRSLAVFAASTVKGNTAHGLDTGRYFEKDLFKDPYPVKNGVISLINN